MLDKPAHGGSKKREHRVSYWIIAPEVETDMVVSSLRRAWLKTVGRHAHFCVASGMSRSRDPKLHWLHGLNRSNQVASGRADLNLRLQLRPSFASDKNSRAAGAPSTSEQRQTLRAQELTRLYNNFLRHKVFQIVRDMCTSITDASLPQWSYAFMMDADTAVNRTNLERFVADLAPTAPLYTGLCKRRN